MNEIEQDLINRVRIANPNNNLTDEQIAMNPMLGHLKELAEMEEEPVEATVDIDAMIDGFAALGILQEQEATTH